MKFQIALAGFQVGRDRDDIGDTGVEGALQGVLDVRKMIQMGMSIDDGHNLNDLDAAIANAYHVMLRCCRTTLTVNNERHRPVVDKRHVHHGSELASLNLETFPFHLVHKKQVQPLARLRIGRLIERRPTSLAPLPPFRR